MKKNNLYIIGPPLGIALITSLFINKLNIVELIFLAAGLGISLGTIIGLLLKILGLLEENKR